MRYKPERALTPLLLRLVPYHMNLVEMRYKPERALTLAYFLITGKSSVEPVEMRYKPERALTPA